MLDKYLEMIRQAPVYDVAQETPLECAAGLSRRLGNRVLLKREDMQQVFSFKLRGAYNKMVQLSEAEKQKGVIAASAGNHAQGVALAANKMGLSAVIVMPKTTPEIKVNAVREYGAEVVLHGNAYDDAYEYAQRHAEEHDLTFVHPYDDPEIIAGQGTVAMEMLGQEDDIDMVFVPVGGGGLIGGIAAYIKAVAPSIKVIGVEPDDAASMYEALKQQRRVVLEQVGIFADGVAVRQVGAEPFRIAQRCVDDMLVVSTDEICAAIKDIFDDTRTIAEPAGALAVAGLKKYVAQKAIHNKTCAAIVSGANMNFDRLRHVAERAELGEQREALMGVTIAERPGSFRKFCEIIGLRGITEFNYRYSDPGQAHIFVGVQMQQGGKDKDSLLKKLRKHDYPVIDMSDNEMAKLHIRYMVGGHAEQVKDERLVRFEFPERPGALLRFLDHMGQQWNISLFHYRNHGADYGRVLVGIQVPANEDVQFQSFLEGLGYRYWHESENPAYALFLGQ